MRLAVVFAALLILSADLSYARRFPTPRTLFLLRNFQAYRSNPVVRRVLHHERNQELASMLFNVGRHENRFYRGNSDVRVPIEERVQGLLGDELYGMSPNTFEIVMTNSWDTELSALGERLDTVTEGVFQLSGRRARRIRAGTASSSEVRAVADDLWAELQGATRRQFFYLARGPEWHPFWDSLSTSTPLQELKVKIWGFSHAPHFDVQLGRNLLRELAAAHRGGHATPAALRYARGNPRYHQTHLTLDPFLSQTVQGKRFFESLDFGRYHLARIFKDSRFYEIPSPKELDPVFAVKKRYVTPDGQTYVLTVYFEGNQRVHIAIDLNGSTQYWFLNNTNSIQRDTARMLWKTPKEFTQFKPHVDTLHEIGFVRTKNGDPTQYKVSWNHDAVFEPMDTAAMEWVILLENLDRRFAVVEGRGAF